jgi:hypothetical protein
MDSGNCQDRASRKVPPWCRSDLIPQELEVLQWGRLRLSGSGLAIAIDVSNLHSFTTGEVDAPLSLDLGRKRRPLAY